jgi:hypothetical protein
MHLLKTNIYKGAQYFGRAADIETLFNHLGAVRVALTPGATMALDATAGSHFTLDASSTGSINCASVGQGELFIIITANAAGTKTITFGTGFKSTGTLATGASAGKIFVVKFVSDGTQYCEVSRTTAM